MLPEEIKNDTTISEWRKMPMNETDKRHVIELWQRKPTDKDRKGDAKTQTPGYFTGEWIDKTAIAKAEWEVVLAEREQERLEQQILKEQMRNRPPKLIKGMLV